MSRDKVVPLLLELVRAIDNASKHGESDEFTKTITTISQDPLVRQASAPSLNCAVYSIYFFSLGSGLEYGRYAGVYAYQSVEKAALAACVHSFVFTVNCHHRI